MRTECQAISVSMTKGGVGKTTTSINLGAALSMQGKKVLLIDNDPQGDMTKALGHLPGSLKYTLANIMYAIIDFGEPAYAEEAIIRVSKNLDLLPANAKLSAVDSRLVSDKATSSWIKRDGEGGLASEKVLRTLVDSVRGFYDYIIIDCEPRLGALTINALCAVDSVLLPLEAHYLGLEALADTMSVISLVQSNLNPELSVQGILVTKYDMRTKLCRSIKDKALELYGTDMMCPVPIPFSVRAAEQPAYGVSIFEHAAGNPVAEAYMQAAKGVLSCG